MTFQEFVQAAEAVRPESSISVIVDHWRHLHGGGSVKRVLEFHIWDADFRKRFTGHTPERALQLYQEHVSGTATPLESVGDISPAGDEAREAEAA